MESSSINIRDEFVCEDYQKDKMELQISSKMVNFSFHKLYKYSGMIQSEIYQDNFISNFSTQINQFQQRMNIKDDSISTFFRLLNEESIEISNDQYCDLYKLAKYFQVKTLQKSLLKYAKQHLKSIDFVICLIVENESKQTFLEDENSLELDQCLINQINECLNNERFGKLPVSMIYRIIKESSKSQIDHNLLFDFIKKKKEERFVLFSFLNLQKLNDSNFSELYKNYISDKKSSIYYEYLSNNLEYINQLRETQKQLEIRISNLENSEKQLSLKLMQTADESQQLKSKLTISEKNNELLQNKVNEIEKENKKLIEKSDDLNEQNKQLNSNLEQINNENKQLKNEIKNINNNNLILKSQIDQLTNKSKQIYEIPYKKEFEGIFNYFRKNSNINEELAISYSSYGGGDSKILYQYENKGDVFWTGHIDDSWICFEIKKHEIIPTNYTIRTYDGAYHPKSWVIEGSIDSINWEIIDEQNNCTYLNGSNLVHTFSISNQKRIKYIRMRQTANNWGNDNHLAINCIEFYGNIV